MSGTLYTVSRFLHVALSSLAVGSTFALFLGEGHARTKRLAVAAFCCALGATLLGIALAPFNPLGAGLLRMGWAHTKWLAAGLLVLSAGVLAFRSEDPGRERSVRIAGALAMASSIAIYGCLYLWRARA